ncbi:hypothetical protein PsWM33_03071 [Pseudovibrio sp. WM33]|nr:hypothetical protein PsWM33_03071 [Pseudovibrio sp. WM33]
MKNTTKVALALFIAGCGYWGVNKPLSVLAERKVKAAEIAHYEEDIGNLADPAFISTVTQPEWLKSNCILMHSKAVKDVQENSPPIVASHIAMEAFYNCNTKMKEFGYQWADLK